MFEHSIQTESLDTLKVFSSVSISEKPDLFGLVVGQSEWAKFNEICHRKFQTKLNSNSFDITSGFSLFGGNEEIQLRNFWNEKVTRAMGLGTYSLKKLSK